MSRSGTTIPVELDWLLGLPLESEALRTLWSAVERDLADLEPQTPACQAARTALQQALATQRWLSLRGRCLDGDWLTALPAFLALLGGEGPHEGPQPPSCPEAAAWGLELLLELHFRLLDPNAPAWELAPDERAELLWLAHALLERLEPLPEPTPERLPVVVEQLSRYGAIAWMERPGPLAGARAIRLLLRLAWVNPESHPWSLQGLRERLNANPEAPLEREVADALRAAPWLEEAITALAELEPTIEIWRRSQASTPGDES